MKRDSVDWVMSLDPAHVSPCYLRDSGDMHESVDTVRENGCKNNLLAHLLPLAPLDQKKEFFSV